MQRWLHDFRVHNHLNTVYDHVVPKISRKKMSNFTNLKGSSNDVDWLEQSIANEHIMEYKYSDFKNIQRIGGGSFGSIFRVNWKDTNTIFALKSFNNQKSTLKEIIKEVNLNFPCV